MILTYRMFTNIRDTSVSHPKTSLTSMLIAFFLELCKLWSTVSLVLPSCSKYLTLTKLSRASSLNPLLKRSIILLQIVITSTFIHFINNKKYQPSGEWGLAHHLQHRTACLIQNGRQFLEVGKNFGYWTLWLLARANI